MSQYINNINSQKLENNLRDIANLICDIEAIFHECFKNALNEFDQNIIKRCKTKISILFRDIGAYNLYMGYDEVQQNNQGFITPLTTLPKVKLYFHGRSVSDSGEDADSISKENEYIESCIKKINEYKQLINNDIINVRKKYATHEDGVLIKIKTRNLTKSQIIERIDFFIEEVRNLSLDELMISQQFTDWFSLENTNPYSLVKNQNHEEGIFISLFYMDSFVPCYYLSIILMSIKKQLSSLNSLDNFKLAYPSINESFVSLSINSGINHE